MISSEIKWFGIVKNNQEFIAIIFILILASLLRLGFITENPPGLYPDEVAIGANAHMILTTGHDEHGVKYPLWFESFGDYKMPVYIYLTSFVMSVMGKSELALRIVSAISGIMTIAIFYFLLKQYKSISTPVRILAVALLTISPWHIHFSRAGFEANLALFFFLYGILFLIKYLFAEKNVQLLVALLFFIMAVYTYHTYRILTPLTFLFFSTYLFIYKRSIFKYFIFVTGLFLLSFLPIIYFTFLGQGGSRFIQTTAVDYQQINSFKESILVPFVLFNNYISHFSFDFLFINGDGFGRHQIENFGQMFKWQAPFLILGFFALLNHKDNYLKLLMLFLIFLTPLAAMFTLPSPHAIRSLLLIIPFTLLVALGINWSTKQIAKFRYLFFLLLSLVVIYEFGHYLHYYYIHYPQVNRIDWDSGNKEIVTKTQQLAKANEQIYVNEGFIDPLYYYFYANNLSPIYIESVNSIRKDEKSLYIRQVRQVNKPIGNVLDTFKLQENYEIEFIYLDNSLK